MDATTKIQDLIENSTDIRVKGIGTNRKETNKGKLNSLIKHLDSVEESFNTEKPNKMNE